MHPTTQAAVGNGGGGGGIGVGDSVIDGEQRTLSGIKLLPQHLKNGSGGQHQNQNIANGHQNGHAQNGTNTNATIAAALTTTAAPTTTPLYNNSNGNGNGNGVGVGSGMNGSALNGFHQNGGRRDSAQMWTPLLANGNGNVNNTNNSNDGGIGDANEDAVMPTTLLYAGNTPSNNNEWKDAEEINNLKNGLLHHAKHHNHNNHNHHHHNHNNHHHHQQGNNNNGSLLLNGKNGLALTATDKYDPEQDPLTGLYKQKKHTRSSESDESDFDSDLTGGGSSGAGTGLSGGERGGKTAHGCGLFGCRPRWARRFASTKCFMVVFLLAYILQGMYMTYFVSVITTIEKLFQIKSKTTGFLLSASEMGQISTAMLLTYFAGRGHRPRWIACGMVLFSIAAFSCSLPHFIFGDQLIQSVALLKPSSHDDLPTTTQMLRSSYGLDIGALPNDTTESTLSASILDANLCQLSVDNSTKNSQECDEDRKMEQASHSKITVIVLCIFFASLLSSGIGQTAVATLGIPYIDDNVASKQSPMYMAITIGVRILGPASGFIVGSFCTRWYVNFSNPGFNASDPRWIGAWWLGPVAIGTLMMLASIAMFSFPSQLRGKSKPTTPAPNGNDANGDGVNATALAAAEEKPKLKDFPKTVRRQLSNDILMFRTASCVFHLLPIAGLYTFLPKYLETQFRLATYDANMVAAFCGILVMGVGIVISGLVILKLKPSARSVSAWIAFTALFYSVGMFILMFIGCSMTDFAGFQPATDNTPALIGQPCSIVDNCNCDKENFAPICGTDGLIYISSCHAGCMKADLHKEDNSTLYSNCECIKDRDVSKSYDASSGYCESKCKNFIIFILIFAVCVFMHSTSEVGSMLLVMRCTHPKDKAMAMGVIQSAIGLFGNVPCPIIYGAVVDSACLIWKTVCGKHGACSLYNADTFRHYFLGITSGIMFLAFIMDIVVWSKAHRIDIALEDGNEHVANDEEGKSPTAECKKSMTDATDTSV